MDRAAAAIVSSACEPAPCRVRIASAKRLMRCRPDRFGRGRPDRHAPSSQPRPSRGWRIEYGTVTGGLMKRISPAMVRTYFEDITGKYQRESPSRGMPSSVTSCAVCNPSI
ncbi:hypothetical protein OG563_33645 [Nocardia vinacea]|uniref:Uncharacterized protein n=1 Tax=Nocardia vinacea TaxID=96468 RepID=A0ABZ1YQ63_9NOCA|nr:hypothetical protein [Nocardia vinacea]